MSEAGRHSEYRQDPLSGNWVLIAPERGHKPQATGQKASQEKPPVYDPACPFCPGNEAMLSAILEETPSKHEPGWQTRIVPNKYPALSPDTAGAGETCDLYENAGAHGYHEVIIEHPHHNADISAMEEQDVAALLETYQKRYRQLSERADIKAVILFRNHGAAAGASRAHPHSQIVATAFQSSLMETKRQRAQRHYEKNGRCLYCDVLAAEQKSGRRIIRENAHFTAFVPYAAQAPFEILILPRWHQADFSAVTEEERSSLATLLRVCLQDLKQAADDPPYNYAITSWHENPDDPALHWHLRIVPRLTIWGGFEQVTNIVINPSRPEEDAGEMREHNA